MVKETNNLIKWGTFIGGIATAIALGVLAYQTVILGEQAQIQRTQFHEKDRPWIALDSITEYTPNKIQFDYTNYGETPNTNAEVLAGFSRNPITKNMTDTIPFKKTSIVLPKQMQHLPLADMDEHYLQEAKSGSSLYIIFVIRYNFHDNEYGEYGYIAKYNMKANNFEVIDSWAK